MGFLYLLSYASLLLQVCFITLALAAGLYYLAELVEEYTVIAKKVIRTLIICTVLTYVLLMCFENEFTWLMIILGLAAQVVHFVILSNFPYVQFLSASFLSGVLLWIVNHYLALQYFQSVYHPMSEVIAYFTICLWLVPFALFVSLGANDNVLPMQNERTPPLENDVVSSYLSGNKKKVGLLSFFQYIKENLLPQTSKKMF